MANDLLGGLDEATLAGMLGSVGDSAQLDDLKDQLAAARKLRTSNSPNTLADSPSNIPNYGGAISDLINRRQGEKDEAAAKAERQAVYTRQAGYHEAVLKALHDMQFGAGAPVAPVPGQAALPGADPTGRFK